MLYSTLRIPSVLFLLLTGLSCTKPAPPVEHSPESSLADLKVRDGLEVTLFASEPMFSNPTNIAIDKRGRVWVCEAYNYRNQYNPKNPVREEGDRIMILEDTDGDGKADKSKIFYQGKDVNSALGISLVGDKVVNNGKHFRQGLVLRCNVDGSNVEVLGSNFRNNFEVAIDPYGTLWQSDNDDDGNKGTRINYVMEYGNYGYTDEMTGASWPARRTNMEKEIPFRHWH